MLGLSKHRDWYVKRVPGDDEYIHDFPRWVQ
jgi:hypothetical protein